MAGLGEKIDNIVSSAALILLVADKAGDGVDKHVGCVFTSVSMDVRRAARQLIQSSRGEAPDKL